MPGTASRNIYSPGALASQAPDHFLLVVFLMPECSFPEASSPSRVPLLSAADVSE